MKLLEYYLRTSPIYVLVFVLVWLLMPIISEYFIDILTVVCMAVVCTFLTESVYITFNMIRSTFTDAEHEGIN
jgi:hypothetical protein